MRTIPALLAMVFCGLLLAAAAFMARGEVVHEQADPAPPSPARAAAMVGAAQNPKWAQVNEESSPGYVPPGDQEVSIATVCMEVPC